MNIHDDRGSWIRSPRKRESRDHWVMAHVDRYEQRAAKAEAAGRPRWAKKYRERAAAWRVELSTNARERFLKIDTEAAQLEQQASDIIAKAGDPRDAAWMRDRAREKRWEAAGFDKAEAMKEFDRAQLRVTLPITQEMLDTLEELGMGRSQKRWIRLALARIAQEALYALQDMPGRKPGEHPRYRFTATKLPGLSYSHPNRTDEREERFLARTAEIQYQLAKAEFSEMAPAPSDAA